MCTISGITFRAPPCISKFSQKKRRLLIYTT